MRIRSRATAAPQPASRGEEVSLEMMEFYVGLLLRELDGPPGGDVEDSITTTARYTRRYAMRAAHYAHLGDKTTCE